MIAACAQHVGKGHNSAWLHQAAGITCQYTSKQHKLQQQLCCESLHIDLSLRFLSTKMGITSYESTALTWARSADAVVHVVCKIEDH